MKNLDPSRLTDEITLLTTSQDAYSGETTYVPLFFIPCTVVSDRQTSDPSGEKSHILAWFYPPTVDDMYRWVMEYRGKRYGIDDVEHDGDFVRVRASRNRKQR